VGLRELNEELPEELQTLWRSVEHEGLDPAAALSRLVVFLRAEPRHKGALRLYQELSTREYSARRSTLSHSHLPPKE
jgi:hypothetical protein